MSAYRRSAATSHDGAPRERLIDVEYVVPAVILFLVSCVRVVGAVLRGQAFGAEATMAATVVLLGVAVVLRALVRASLRLLAPHPPAVLPPASPTRETRETRERDAIPRSPSLCSEGRPSSSSPRTGSATSARP